MSALRLLLEPQCNNPEQWKKDMLLRLSSETRPFLSGQQKNNEMGTQIKQTFGKLTIIDEDQNSGICLCQCKCGKSVFVHKDYLVSRVITSCGCSKARAIDLTGQRFGNLTVIAPVQDHDVDNSVRWRCRCDCGSYTTVSSNKLRTGHTSSCGCQKSMKANAAKTFVDGTCVEILFSKKVRKNNTSGHTGVSRKGNKWQAYLTYGHKQFSLGTYMFKEEAIQARKGAESRARDRLMAFMNSSAEQDE